jgi:hypothetical protein
MTAKEKAEKLINMFSPHAKNWDCFYDVPLDENHAKQCALIAVDEIINALNDDQSTLGLYENGVAVTDKSFWQEVKQELENL